ncbi:MAG: hypothetical protein Q9204_001288 [Flavoplaca sp. TL-2023a]
MARSQEQDDDYSRFMKLTRESFIKTLFTLFKPVEICGAGIDMLVHWLNVYFPHESDKKDMCLDFTQQSAQVIPSSDLQAFETRLCAVIDGAFSKLSYQAEVLLSCLTIICSEREVDLQLRLEWCAGLSTFLRDVHEEEIYGKGKGKAADGIQSLAHTSNPDFSEPTDEGRPSFRDSQPRGRRRSRSVDPSEPEDPDLVHDSGSFWDPKIIKELDLDINSSFRQYQSSLNFIEWSKNMPSFGPDFKNFCRRLREDFKEWEVRRLKNEQSNLDTPSKQPPQVPTTGQPEQSTLDTPSKQPPQVPTTGQPEQSNLDTPSKQPPQVPTTGQPEQSNLDTPSQQPPQVPTTGQPERVISTPPPDQPHTAPRTGQSHKLHHNYDDWLTAGTSKPQTAEKSRIVAAEKPPLIVTPNFVTPNPFQALADTAEEARTADATDFANSTGSVPSIEPKPSFSHSTKYNLSAFKKRGATRQTPSVVAPAVLTSAPAVTSAPPPISDIARAPPPGVDPKRWVAKTYMEKIAIELFMEIDGYLDLETRARIMRNNRTLYQLMQARTLRITIDGVFKKDISRRPMRGYVHLDPTTTGPSPNMHVEIISTEELHILRDSSLGDDDMIRYQKNLCRVLGHLLGLPESYRNSISSIAFIKVAGVAKPLLFQTNLLSMFKHLTAVHFYYCGNLPPDHIFQEDLHLLPYRTYYVGHFPSLLTDAGLAVKKACVFFWLLHRWKQTDEEFRQTSPTLESPGNFIVTQLIENPPFAYDLMGMINSGFPIGPGIGKAELVRFFQTPIAEGPAKALNEKIAYRNHGSTSLSLPANSNLSKVFTCETCELQLYGSAFTKQALQGERRDSPLCMHCELRNHEILVDMVSNDFREIEDFPKMKGSEAKVNMQLVIDVTKDGIEDPEEIAHLAAALEVSAEAHEVSSPSQTSQQPSLNAIASSSHSHPASLSGRGATTAQNLPVHTPQQQGHSSTVQQIHQPTVTQSQQGAANPVSHPAQQSLQTDSTVPNLLTRPPQQRGDSSASQPTNAPESDPSKMAHETAFVLPNRAPQQQPTGHGHGHARSSTQGDQSRVSQGGPSASAGLHTSSIPSWRRTRPQTTSRPFAGQTLHQILYFNGSTGFNHDFEKSCPFALLGNKCEAEAKGISCQLSHDVTTLDDPNVDVTRPETIQTCIHFIKSGYCKYGDNCTRSHQDVPTRQIHAAPPRLDFCRNNGK